MQERAPRNRTLRLSQEEKVFYQQKLITSEDLLQNQKAFLNRTINDDMMDTLPLLPDEFADLIIIDPPYNLTKDFNGKVFTARTHEQYIEYLRLWLPLVIRKLKRTGSLYLCGDWKCSAAMYEVLADNLHILNRITWQREKGRGAQANWKNCMEDIWFAIKDPHHYYFNVDAVKVRRQVVAPYRDNGKPKDWEETEEGNFRMTCPSNFWDDISVPFWSMPENTDHPTQKPEKLIAKLILASSQEGDMVFDPFLGSGTTSVVAKKLNRNYCGIEINSEYCCWAEKRLDMAMKDTSIQGYTNGVFWERNTLKQQTESNTIIMKRGLTSTQHKQLTLF
jgi:site-specific DNA-methyltransferase (adenine-specific)